MSAAPPRAGRDQRPRATRSRAHPPETAFDVERTHIAFAADIAQLATVVRRLLASGPPRPKALPHLHLM